MESVIGHPLASLLSIASASTTAFSNLAFKASDALMHTVKKKEKLGRKTERKVFNSYVSESESWQK